MTTQAQVQPIECAFCHNIFLDTDVFNAHIASEHNPAEVKCATCGKSFIGTRGAGNLARHMAQFHKIKGTGKGRRRGPRAVSPRVVTPDPAVAPPMPDTVTETPAYFHAPSPMVGQDEFTISLPALEARVTHLEEELHRLYEQFHIHQRRVDGHTTPAPTVGTH